MFPNKTWVRAITDDLGEAALDLYTANLPMTMHAAGSGFAAGFERAWTPSRGGLLLEFEPLQSGGAAIFAQSKGHFPGLHGRLNPVRDTSDRTCLYADNIAIDEGRPAAGAVSTGKADAADGCPWSFPSPLWTSSAGLPWSNTGRSSRDRPVFFMQDKDLHDDLEYGSGFRCCLIDQERRCKAA